MMNPWPEPAAQSESTRNWERLAGAAFAAGFIPLCFLLLVLFLENLNIRHGGKGLGYIDGAMIGFFVMLFLLPMAITALFPAAIYLLNIRHWRGPKRPLIGAIIGMLCSLTFISMIFVPRHMEARSRAEKPREYRTYWPFVEAMLKNYKIQYGEYPPLLMPYLKPDLDWENETAFPGDDYHKPRVQRYWYEQISKRWTDGGKPMKENPTPADFDFTGYYRYYSDGKGYILIGNGPDCDADLDAKESFLAARKGDRQKLIVNKYDPTNGADSGGDYYVLKLR